MSLYYSILARARMVLQSESLDSTQLFGEEASFPRRIIRQAARLAWTVLLPREYGWVRVESGLAQGLWLRLRLTSEGSYWLGYHEAAVQELLRRLCRPGLVFYDVGAHLGFFSFCVVNLIGPTTKVFAFEADPEHQHRMNEMVLRNRLDNQIKIIRSAVWSDSPSGGVPFRRGRNRNPYGGVCATDVSPVLADGETLTVAVTTLDDFVRQGHAAPDIVKIDVEGGECEVLKGAEGIFLRSRPILVCEVHHRRAWRWISDWLANKRYAGEWRIPEQLFPRMLVARPGELD